MSSDWFIVGESKAHSPLTYLQIEAYAQRGLIHGETLVRQGERAPLPAKEFRFLANAIAAYQRNQLRKDTSSVAKVDGVAWWVKGLVGLAAIVVIGAIWQISRDTADVQRDVASNPIPATTTTDARSVGQPAPASVSSVAPPPPFSSQATAEVRPVPRNEPAGKPLGQVVGGMRQVPLDVTSNWQSTQPQQEAADAARRDAGMQSELDRLNQRVVSADDSLRLLELEISPLVQQRDRILSKMQAILVSANQIQGKIAAAEQEYVRPGKSMTGAGEAKQLQMVELHSQAAAWNEQLRPLQVDYSAYEAQAAGISVQIEAKQRDGQTWMAERSKLVKQYEALSKSFKTGR